MRAADASCAADGGMPFELVGWADGDTALLRARHAGEVRALLAALLHSRAAAQRVLARAGLTRAGAPLGAGLAVAAGELLELALQVPEGPKARAAGEVRVVYQDRLLLAVDKPAGLLVHGDGTGAPTLTAQVQGLLAVQGSRARAQAVQRLDVDTTGLVLFSLSEEFQAALDAQVAGHDMRKRYLAVVRGSLARDEDGWHVLDGPIARDRHDARRMRVGATGRPALTRVRALEERDGLSLLLVELGSGRRHQIRVHLAHAGHPIVGDTLYGGLHGADGLMLHAWEERLSHPATGEALCLRTAYPARFARHFPEPRGSGTTVPL